MGIRSNHPLFWVSKFEDLKFYQTADKYNSEKLKQSTTTLRLADPQDNFTGPISPITMNKLIGLMETTEPTKDIAVKGVLPTTTESEAKDLTLWTTTCQCPSGKTIKVLSKDSNCFSSLCRNGYKMGCQVKKKTEIEYTEAICFIKDGAITDPSEVFYSFSGNFVDMKVTPESDIKDLVQGKDGDPLLIDSPQSGTPGRNMDFLGQNGPEFWGFEKIKKISEDIISVQRPKDNLWKLTFESPTLNYAAKLLQFEGEVSWTTSKGSLEPSDYEAFILVNGDMCMNVLSQNFPLKLSSTKGKFIFTLGTSLGQNMIGWEISERCDLGCQKCQPRQKYSDEWMFFDLFMGQTPIRLEEGENGNIQV
jgi:hypothetical protein